ncbi:NAD(P)-dependent alcohol dehydrogenase [Fulvivirga sedimenti]|uniref:NAD(P)-dependent alcohol dehydrogenase n=1 Tax=Fulvivirga sedimenti TaxID=2879465 RepID=A0A9X1HLB4_9BACT|nr:NAD(P)-dependent alcohol dehydrogenase [Fulvivirga sedimenti]MCA6074100.1 NAD(P)-dependent alcohol dehydrogenase [Fulvivirga sedimenti]
MKAFVLTRYGEPEDLTLMDVDKPTPATGQVLVKVMATAINDYDWAMVRGKPDLYRLLFGITKPKSPVPGMELSGIVEAVGDNVTLLKPGDRVYGDISQFGFGTFAEYVCVNEKAFVHIPGGMSFEEAASLSHASMLAYQALYDYGKIGEGMKILINGGGGGVGFFGLQLAKLHGAEVTGVDTGDKLLAMKSIGFDYVIDYKREDFTRNGKKYDLIVDTKTTRSSISYLRSLNTNGQYVTVGGYLHRILETVVMNPVISLFSNKRVKLVPLVPNKDLGIINHLYSQGKLKCMIDGPYSFDKIPWALRYFGEGRHTGKVVIHVSR